MINLELLKLQCTQIVDKVIIPENTEELTLVDVMDVLANPNVSKLLLNLIGWFNFEKESGHNVDILAAVKVLRYTFNLPLGYLFLNLIDLLQVFAKDDLSNWGNLLDWVMDNCATENFRLLLVDHEAAREQYEVPCKDFEELEPQLVHPTTIYKTNSGRCYSSQDSSKIEAFLETQQTASIRIKSDVISLENKYLRNLYKPLGRCVMVIDSHVDGIWGTALQNYFANYDIELIKLCFRAHEADKNIASVQKILEEYKRNNVNRNQPVLVVGGGVITDLAGFACALYHRGTPYIMLCTSIVSGIDAGPSPRTCCDGMGYKNIFGAFHPPVLTITDRSFFNTLNPGWLRHGIAEIVKMAVVKDFELFELLEEMTTSLVETKFGTECEDDCEYTEKCDLIISKAMDAYVQSEYHNLWECHQNRPHAYGHTWSPGFELPAGLLHGHAISIGMGFGAYLSFAEGWISEEDFHRILKLFSDLELSLNHPILDDAELLWSCQVRMIEKRGGNLCAPLPKGRIGDCGYKQAIPREELLRKLDEYRHIVRSEYPREGLGIEMHCTDVGLEDPRNL